MRDLDRLADRIRLHRQGDRRQVAIVEGQSDERILKRAFDDAEVMYFQAGTRKVALDAAVQLADWKQEYFICVVDRDFDDEVADLHERYPTLHPYENADLEAMLVVSKVGADLIAEFGSVQKIAARGGISGILGKLYEMLDPVTRLRRANAENGWGISFDDVDLAGKIEKRHMILRLQPYCAALSATSHGSPGQAVLYDYAMGVKSVGKYPACPRGSQPYFRGRDFLVLLGAALSGYCGSRKPQSVDFEGLAASLRLAGAEYLRTSQWGVDFLTLLNLSE
ncbi:DUF4435 domain-containing protein [Streptomyces sp. NBC_01451]|uniref:DUF4435 domain-containing protein n=1 Tax=Streptomyces sp. NBC_01451 TaxID=2903872 RepID=UPI002E325041|nr:DUF4435 domain-containing protein [Streptomyces sp. NBC_01451]